MERSPQRESTQYLEVSTQTVRQGKNRKLVLCIAFALLDEDI